MSTLRVNTIQNAAGSGDPSLNGTAKAWVNFNGTGTVAIRASFNVTSITDNGVGDYTVNFTNAMADANYTATLSYSSENGARSCATDSVTATAAASARTTSALRVGTFNPGVSANDCVFINVAIFR